ncbi:hypothetical protein M3Y98_00077100 [Aphelenchoides besseyi]|nr:hypothetical protein M3Y98_00077100 [Aphelenchoides besseyi]KAI6198694.1 hypothetical protein M3Y96_00546800 [Aphelenchoides besseyi]
MNKPENWIQCRLCRACSSLFKSAVVEELHYKFRNRGSCELTSKCFKEHMSGLQISTMSERRCKSR